MRFVGGVIPQASAGLRLVRERALRIPDAALREQALASIDQKAYHVQGGSILATFLSREDARRFIEAVTPLESIYDYLDNLCDRLPGVESKAYASLHEALLDAVDASRAPADYYRDGPFLDDGGYLASLVTQSRGAIVALPGYGLVAERVHESVRLYSELQQYKHFASPQREERCARWYAANAARFPGLHWWEFAAACGSSLPVFAMLYLALAPGVLEEDVRATYRAYVPDVSAVHILLDYFIDQAEDREHGELNFIECYASLDEAVGRMRELTSRAFTSLRRLRDGSKHAFVMHAMCTFYLTHRKVFEQRLDRESAAVLRSLG